MGTQDEQEIREIRAQQCEIFRLSFQLANHNSLKVTNEACLVLQQFLKSVVQGVKYDEVFPNGIQDIAPQLFQLAMERGKLPLDLVRLHDICLEQTDTEDEELYLRLSDTLSYMLSTIVGKMPDLA